MQDSMILGCVLKALVSITDMGTPWDPEPLPDSPSGAHHLSLYPLCSVFLTSLVI